MSETVKPKFVRKGISSIEIFEVLKGEIVNGTLQGNTQLKQAKLAHRFGVSKIPVREALRRLEANGLIVFRPRFGATVTALSSEDVIDLLDVRLALECRAIELSIPKLTQSELSLAHEVLKKYTIETVHNILYQACERPKLLGYIEDVKNRMGPFLMLNITMATGLDRPHEEHKQLLAACEQGNVELASNILREHIITTQMEVASFIHKSSNP